MGWSDLIVVGAGAAGLMAGAHAAHVGLEVVLLERKHQPGRKLLMCGNNRCNLSHRASADEMMAVYGDPVGPFLNSALRLFPPSRLVDWFARHRVPTKPHRDGRIFPTSEKADHVLHLFTDLLREGGVPLITNFPAAGIRPADGGFLVESPTLTLGGRCVLVATGGVSYPKTGSVGDGQKFARALGHRIEPYRAGLVGFEFPQQWLRPHRDISLPGTETAVVSNGKVVAATRGEILFTRRCARGPAMVNASRIVARLGLRDYSFRIDLCPNVAVDDLSENLAARIDGDWIRPAELPRLLGAWLVPAGASGVAAAAVTGEPGAGRSTGKLTPSRIANALKGWELAPTRMRPLKEAMVTVGGVALRDVDPKTMESRRCPGLFFAGEVLDVDGPTGGFNLHAAFATARLAVEAAAARVRGT